MSEENSNWRDFLRGLIFIVTLPITLPIAVVILIGRYVKKAKDQKQ